MNSKRGEVVTLLVVILAAAGVGLVAGWKPLSIFKKGPPTAQLADTQAELAKAKADLAAADAKLKAAEAKNEQAKDSQVGYSQQMTAGVGLALAKAPISPEVVLARSLNERASLGLEQAIGRLPEAERLQIVTIVEGMLSVKEAEVKAAKEALEVKDRELAAVSQERDAVKAQIPLLVQEVDANRQEVALKDAQVQAKVQEVARYADKAAAEAKANGSLGQTINRLLMVLAGLAILYVLGHIFLPSVAQSYPAIGWLQKLDQAANNFTTTREVPKPVVPPVSENNTKSPV